MREKIRLSQCMIVKNEEKNIERALSWGKDIMWEQIVVDTGSTDRTVELAEKMGAAVYHFQWIDDFSAAKNYAIHQAKGDWIVFLDADEYFLPEEAKRLLPFLRKIKDGSCNALVTSWIQTDGSEEILQDKTEGKMKWHVAVKEDGSKATLLSGTQIRIFANQPGICYRGRIHEKIGMEEGELVCLDASEEFSILHTGYTPSEMQEKKKTERNIALIKRELEEKPNDYKMLSFLGDSYFQQKNQKEAAYWYEKAVSCMPGKGSEESIQDAMIFKHLLVIYMELKEEKSVLKAYADGIRRFPKEADYDYLMGRYYTEQKQFQKGEYHLKRALQILNQCGSDRKSMLLARNLLEAWEGLIQCCYENGNLQQCVSSAVTILKADAWRTKTLIYMLLAFRKDAEQKSNAASPSQVLAFLQNFYDFGNLENKLFVLNAAKSADYCGLAEEIKKIFR